MEVFFLDNFNVNNNLDLNIPDVNEYRSSILNFVVPLARLIVPKSIDDNGNLKSEYEFFVVYSILGYQMYLENRVKNLLNKDNG